MRVLKLIGAVAAIDSEHVGAVSPFCSSYRCERGILTIDFIGYENHAVSLARIQADCNISLAIQFVANLTLLGIPWAFCVVCELWSKTLVSRDGGRASSVPWSWCRRETPQLDVLYLPCQTAVLSSHPNWFFSPSWNCLPTAKIPRSIIQMLDHIISTSSAHICSSSTSLSNQVLQAIGIGVSHLSPCHLPPFFRSYRT